MDLQTLLQDAGDVKTQLENAIAAHNSGSLTPNDLHSALDAANTLLASIATAMAEPQGSPVPDTGDGGSTAGTIPAPTDDATGEAAETEEA
jgi:hypothetical protein